MCGIVGIISPNFGVANIEKAIGQLAQRGPSAKGCFIEKGAILGHRRLSILDLSSAANQPFHSQCGRYVMVYNGEIYNYKVIATQHNISTKTTSDTEVILESFVKNGMDCVQDFNGMFAIAIWDKQEQTLYFFRDRMGIKPLFIYQNGEHLAFASEMKAIKALSLPLSIDNNAIASFLYLGYVPPPLTIYRECKKFPAGCYGIYKDKQLSIESYWTVEHKIKSSAIQEETRAKQILKETISKSVERRLISDVPLGTFLSGGIDSSLVTAVAQSKQDQPIKTFSIGFKEAKYNEAQYAKAVAQQLKTDHHEFILSEQDALEQVEQLLNIYDEPFADSSAIPTLLVSKMAKQYVTVCLSGDGGDELFMGYGRYDWAKRLNYPIPQAIRKLLSWGLKTFGDSRLKNRASIFDYPTEKNKISHIFSQEQGFYSVEELKKLLVNKDNIYTDLPESLTTKRHLTAAELQSLFDIKYYLKDDLLVKVDRASMFHSLEVRVPLLDQELLEFALNLHPNLKQKGNIRKYLLKEVLYDYLPKQLFDRPKWGFSIPLEQWLKKDLNYLIDKHLTKVDDTLFRQSMVDEYVNRFLGGESYLYNRVWSLILLQKWLTENV